MPISQPWVKLSLCVLTTATLSGCALDPIGLAINAVSMPSEVSLVEEVSVSYRLADCNELERWEKTFLEDMSAPARARKATAINLQAVRQVQREKNCGPSSSATKVAGIDASLGKAQPGVQAGVAATGGVPIVQPAEPQGIIGVVAEPVTNEIAQAAGLSQSRGLLVTQLLEGKAAVASGIRLGDIVLEINGTPIDDVNQMRRTLGVVPDGQNVMARLWRGKEQRDLIVGPISSNTPALPPGAVYAGAPVQPVLPNTDRFCVLKLTGSGMFADSLLTPLLALRNDGSEKANAKVAAAFMQSVQQAQPGKWQSQPALYCNKESSVCTSVNSKPETLMMLCETDQSKGAAIHDSLQSQKSTTAFPWTPPAT